MRLLIENDHLPHVGQLRTDGTHLLELRATDDDEAHVAVLHAEEQVVALFEFDAQGHVDRTGIEHGQLAHDPKVAPLGEQRHAVASLHA